MRVILYNTLLFVFLATCFARGQNLSEAEYFFDNDPGVGNGVPLPSFSPLDTVDLNFQVDISTLSDGFHNLFIRFKDQDGKWGIYEGRSFYVIPDVTLSQSSDLFEAEYFFDTDPGVGNGVVLPAFSPSDTVDLNFQADISSLSDGFHNLFIRFKDQDGKWGIYEGRSFYVIPDVTLSQSSDLFEAEYFFDTDPGVGNGVALPSFSPSDTVDLNFQADISSLSDGYHNLFIRFKDQDGKWGIYEGRSFYVAPDVTLTQASDLLEAEYFFDTDPGVGNGIALPSFSPSDTVDLNFQADVSSLAIGVHNLFIRFKDQDGKWGIYEGREFEIANCSSPTAEFTTASQVCLGEALTMTDNSTNVDPTAAYEWDIDSDGTIDYTTVGDITHTFSASGNYNVTLTVINDGGCTDTYVENVDVIDYSAITDIQEACDSYTWSANGTTYTTSGQYTETLTSTLGCDSIVTLDLTIGTATTGTDVVEACETFTWIDGNTYTADNNTATHTLTNAAGCDSVVTLDLTINQPTTGTDVVVTCNDYTWIDGNTYTTSNNTATYTLTSAAGCDSVVSLDLTIQSFVTGTDVVSACETFTWIDGNTYTADNNTATHTLTSSEGCDSIVTLDLTIGQPTSGTDIITACDSYTWIDGNSYTSDNNTATHTLTNVAGCDSVVTLDLTINNSTSGTDQITACNSYTWIDGNTYTSSNNAATYTLTNAAGCDSVVTLDLTINSVDNGVTVTNDTELNADQTGADYQWLDCDDNYAPISGETNQQFVVTTNGIYAVEVTINNCSDTSDCIEINDLKIGDQSPLSEITVYPNPTDGEVNIDLGKLQDATIELSTIEGKLLSREQATQSTHMIDIKAPKGLFIIKVSYDGTSKHFKVVKM